MRSMSEMSILNYFKRKKPEERRIFLPAPVSTECISEEDVALCNKEVEAVIVRQENTKQPYHSYSSQQRADIGRYAAQHGPTAASRHFTKQLGHPVPESTPRKYSDFYRKELESSRKRHAESLPTITELPPRKRGRPLLLGDFDSPVQEYVRMLRISGGVVNAPLVLAATRGLIITRNRALLVDYGGSLNPDNHGLNRCFGVWASSKGKLQLPLGYLYKTSTLSRRASWKE